jgi:urea-proton symporter
MDPEKVFIFLRALSFSLVLLLMVPASRYQNEIQTSEMFSTAGRTVRSGLVASAVVSSWTW